VLDDHLGPTDWLVRCRNCKATYLLEMLDFAKALRLYRVRLVDPDAGRGLMRDLDRGSCDLSRAGEQARHLSLSSTRLPGLVLLDLHGNVLLRIVETDVDVAVPGDSWRELACDGRWIQRLG
jgi:hypothetical protein